MSFLHQLAHSLRQAAEQRLRSWTSPENHGPILNAGLDLTRCRSKTAPQWTSDGDRLFVQTSPFGGRRIVTVDAKTGAVLDLSKPRSDAWFDLGPKGERLLLTNGRGGFWVVEVIVD